MMIAALPMLAIGDGDEAGREEHGLRNGLSGVSRLVGDAGENLTAAVGQNGEGEEGNNAAGALIVFVGGMEEAIGAQRLGKLAAVEDEHENAAHHQHADKTHDQRTADTEELGDVFKTADRNNGQNQRQNDAENAKRLRRGETQNGPGAGRVAAADQCRQIDPLGGGDDQHEPHQRACVVEQRAAEGKLCAERALHPVVKAAGFVTQRRAVLRHHEGIGDKEQQCRQDQDRNGGIAHLIVASRDVVEGEDLHDDHEDNVLNA